MSRILICGGPGTGKSTFAATLGIDPVWHCDDLEALPWSEQSWAVYRWLNRPGPWVIEGTAAVRGLRKWLKVYNKGLPFDTVYWLEKQVEPATMGQMSMKKGARTIWDEIEPDLVLRRADLRVIY